MPDSTPSRRRLLTASLALGAGAATSFTLPSLLDRPTETGRVLHSRAPLPKPFQVPLPIPPVLRPTSTEGGIDRYRITQRASRAELLPDGLTTPLWGYDGIFPGPTIVSRRGRTTVVRHRNELPVPTVVHLHGGRTPADSDGYPTDLLLPAPDAAHRRTDPHAQHHGRTPQKTGHGGEPNRHGQGTGPHAPDPRAHLTRGSREYTFPLDQPAATLWYHDHRMDFTAPAIYRGLAGFHLVRDDIEDALPLPHGERELPLMIADRAFAADGSFDYPSLDPELHTTPGVREEFTGGVLGDVILVNGAPWPEHEVTATRHRLRILNGSNARRYHLALDPPPPGGGAFRQIGADQGLLAAPRDHDTLPTGPAERHDVVVDFGRYPVGSTVTLVNRLGSGGTRQVMRFRVTRRAADDSHVPRRLAEIEPLHRSQATVTREFAFQAGQVHGRPGWLIGRRPFAPDRIEARPQLGAVELWRFVADAHHPVHLHLVGFQILARGNGRRPGPHDAGVKDTVHLRPGESTEVIARFDGYRGRFLFHCHNAEHEDMAMMANFEVV
ncbi:Spore coat protein A [Streptomyces sp. YIM 130001]|uniref:multicopper oxidase family protein n=1 Tax=Streptomyces sp. YIM 130001 TaxID=2259644 RepID=UPI000E6513E2|nr:multicopper oxidase family protein [Streptomyces sp. YIM 130001]RII18403.1 Spore coat protein A [Streptomyces sp. YIM 130001]